MADEVHPRLMPISEPLCVPAWATLTAPTSDRGSSRFETVVLRISTAFYWPPPSLAIAVASFQSLSFIGLLNVLENRHKNRSGCHFLSGTCVAVRSDVPRRLVHSAGGRLEDGDNAG